MGDLKAGIYQDVVEEHFGRAAALFTQRHAVVRSRAVRLVDLASLDRDLRAHLDALTAAGDVGRDLLGDCSRWRGSSRAFVQTVVAGYRGNRDALEAVVAGHSDASHEPGLVAALGWLSPRVVAPILEDWLAYDAPRWRALALAAHVAHRIEPRGAVARAIHYDDDPTVRREAVRAAGVLGFRSLAPALRRLYDCETGELRFLIGRTLLQLHQIDAPRLLWDCACEAREWSETAAELAARHVTAGEAHRWIGQVAALTRLSRVALVAAASTGQPAFAPYLLDAIDDPDLGALAGYGLHTMTGVDLEAEGLSAEGHDGPDAELPRPDAAKVWRWWSDTRRRFHANQRWLLGRPLDRHAMQLALWHGPQRLRVLVAHDLHRLLGGDRVPFEVDAPGWRQQRRLAAALHPQRRGA